MSNSALLKEHYQILNEKYLGFFKATLDAPSVPHNKLISYMEEGDVLLPGVFKSKNIHLTFNQFVQNAPVFSSKVYMGDRKIGGYMNVPTNTEIIVHKDYPFIDYFTKDINCYVVRYKGGIAEQQKKIIKTHIRTHYGLKYNAKLLTKKGLLRTTKNMFMRFADNTLNIDAESSDDLSKIMYPQYCASIIVNAYRRAKLPMQFPNVPDVFSVYPVDFIYSPSFELK